jgi:hypothetical protein
MSWTLITAVAWLVAVLVVYAWSRPSEPEKAVLSRYPPAARLLLFNPLSQGWREMLNAADSSALGGLRRRSVLSVTAVVLLSAGWIVTSRVLPGRAPQVARAPGRVEPRAMAPIPRPEKREAFLPPQPVKPKASPLPPRPVAPALPGPPDEKPDDSATTHTVTLSDDKALSEPRKLVRLFGAANVKPLYDSSYKKILGVQVNHIKPGTFWQTLGIRNGDVIVEFNGELVDNTEASNHLMTALGQEQVLHLRVRGADGKERYLDYETPE